LVIVYNMKKGKIELINPCQEDWDKMESVEQGHFCKKCSKTVVDFNEMTTAEVLNYFSTTKSPICGRIRKSQLKEPVFFGTEKHRNYRYPSKIGAGLILATSVIAGPHYHCSKPKVQIVSANNKLDESEKPESVSLRKILAPEPKCITIKGTILDTTNYRPIINAQITFYTLSKYFTAFSQIDGTFSLEVPSEFVSEKNLLRFSYYNVLYKVHYSYHRYETMDLVINKGELNQPMKIIAEIDEPAMGGMIAHYYKENGPIVFRNGSRWEINAFLNQYFNKNPNHELKSGVISYFEPEIAEAYLGAEGKNGMYLLHHAEF